MSTGGNGSSASNATIILPATLGIQPILSSPGSPAALSAFANFASSGYPPPKSLGFGRGPALYVWVIRKWIKTPEGASSPGLFGGMRNHHGHNSNSNGHSGRGSQPEFIGLAEVEVRVEWKRGKKSKSKKKSKDNAQVGDAEDAESSTSRGVSCSGSQRRWSIVASQSSPMGLNSSLPTSETSQARKRRNRLSTAVRASANGDPDTTLTSSLFGRRRSKTEDDDGNNSDPEDSETPWTCMLKHILGLNLRWKNYDKFEECKLATTSSHSRTFYPNSAEYGERLPRDRGREHRVWEPTVFTFPMSVHRSITLQHKHNHEINIGSAEGSNPHTANILLGLSAVPGQIRKESGPSVSSRRMVAGRGGARGAAGPSRGSSSATSVAKPPSSLRQIVENSKIVSLPLTEDTRLVSFWFLWTSQREELEISVADWVVFFDKHSPRMVAYKTKYGKYMATTWSAAFLLGIQRLCTQMLGQYARKDLQRYETEWFIEEPILTYTFIGGNEIPGLSSPVVTPSELISGGLINYHKFAVDFEMSVSELAQDELFPEEAIFISDLVEDVGLSQVGIHSFSPSPRLFDPSEDALVDNMFIDFEAVESENEDDNGQEEEEDDDGQEPEEEDADHDIDVEEDPSPINNEVEFVGKAVEQPVRICSSLLEYPTSPIPKPVSSSAYTSKSKKGQSSHAKDSGFPRLEGTRCCQAFAKDCDNCRSLFCKRSR
ncbi:hypothetical protein BT96DRAFT_1104534 [Gymnopus androsaceus JB14]|uniref:Uncharacterized protein n=1 Tax=Gymnopus androsaceus JB14 TaxID=1447944 RepID=A0A6A4GEJ3_9AGAR|nr:hypothetical protein BT96DRAFT_1104534 [Gymnopus androsaceus JB14]